MDEQGETVFRIARAIRKGVRTWLELWPRRRKSLELLLISVLAEVSTCDEFDLIVAVDQHRAPSYWMDG